MTALAATAAAAAASWAATWLLLKTGGRLPVYDVPNERSSHNTPTLRLGGVAIAVGLGLAAMVLLRQPAMRARPETLWVLAGGLYFFFLGLCEDVYQLPEWVRLLAQTAFAALMAAFGPRLSGLELPGLGTFSLPDWASVLATTVWYVGYVNSFNFMDGTDGMAAGQAVVVGSALAILGGIPLGWAVAGAALGFLLHNLQPSRIFMGDSGSYLLGFALAGMSVSASSEAGHGPLPFLAVCLLSATFIADTTVTLARRVSRGETWFKAHRSHHYQQMTDAGYSHRAVAAANFSLTALFAVASSRYAHSGDLGRVGILCAAMLALGTGFKAITSGASRRRGGDGVR